MPRMEPPYAADERTMLVSFLDYFRETMCMFVDDLTPEQLRWTPADGSNSIASIIRHLWYVEEWWFHECLQGLKPELPYDPDGDQDQDFVVPDQLTATELVDTYRGVWERANAAIAQMPLETVAKHPKGAERGVTLRWILVHMIEETARHAGHADITRQLIDGRTGI
jgi:uncharacterized damage-inducible protein DinB